MAAHSEASLNGLSRHSAAPSAGARGRGGAAASRFLSGTVETMIRRGHPPQHSPILPRVIKERSF